MTCKKFLSQSLKPLYPVQYTSKRCRDQSNLSMIMIFSHVRRYAITEAAKMCSTAIVNLFLLVDATAFSSLTDFKQFTHDLLIGLCSLANFGLVEDIMNIISHLGLFPDSAYLWQSTRSVRLLYILIESRSHDSLKLSDVLAFDLASYLIRSKLPLQVAEDYPLCDTHHATKLMLDVESYSHAFARCNSSNVRLLLRLAKFYNALASSFHQYAFHYLCGQGNFELVSRYLSILDSSYHSKLFRYVNDRQQSPLYYAACGGHFDIVDLLLDKGCEQYCPNEAPPIEGALYYLVLSVPHYSGLRSDDIMLSNMVQAEA